MTRYAAHFRNAAEIRGVLLEAIESFQRVSTVDLNSRSAKETIEILRNRQLSLAHVVYLSAILYQIESGVGPRWSEGVIDGKEGTPIRSLFPDAWRVTTEDVAFRKKILYSRRSEDGNVIHHWRDAPEIPTTDEWFENVWRDDKNGQIFDRKD